MRRQRGLITAAAGALALIAAAGIGAAAVAAQSDTQLVAILDATPGHCSVRTTAPACFSPGSVTVAPGTTVEWFNRSQLAHTVTGQDWGSGNIASNRAYWHTFDTPGYYSYHCTIHPAMTGSVYVVDTAASSSSSGSTSSGATSFSISSPQNQPFSSTTTSGTASTSSGAVSATSSDTTGTDVALAGGDSGSDTLSFSADSHSSVPAAALKPGGSGLSPVLVAVLLLVLIGGASTAALLLTRPGRAARR